MDAKQQLPQHLREADAETLLALVRAHLPDLDARDARAVLRNPFAGVEVIELLLGRQRLTAAYEVRQALVRHPATPQAASLRLAPGLFWRDLLEVSLDYRLAPVLRRTAERYLVERLPALTLGEKISLARRAGTRVLTQLRAEPNLRVLTALLENPRSTEGTILPLVSRAGTPPEVLTRIAEDRRWGVRYSVRLALARNSNTPASVSLKLLRGFKRGDLQGLSKDLRVAMPVRQRARELLQGRQKASLRGDRVL